MLDFAKSPGFVGLEMGKPSLPSFFDRPRLEHCMRNGLACVGIRDAGR